MRFQIYLPLFLSSFFITEPQIWGFFGHKKITEMAIYTLPTDIIGFYKQNASQLIEKSVAADQRRYVIEAEAPRHYIDLDDYDHADSIPKYWMNAIERYGEDTLIKRGTVPWHAFFAYKMLVQAYSEKDYNLIVLKSADLAHYIGDAHVPLHTTSNYNGQETNQEGVHGFWETRLPELFSADYDFIVGKAAFRSDIQGDLWRAILEANSLVDSLLYFEREITALVGEEKKFAFEDKGKRTVKVYSRKYSQAYHDAMPVVEKQMQRAIKLIGDCWFTAWVEAGQPDLMNADVKIEKEEKQHIDDAIVPVRSHKN